MNSHKNTPQVIIGIDPGTNVTGFGVIHYDGFAIKAIDYGCIRPPALKLSERYLIIYNALEQLLEKYQPHNLAVETQYSDKNIQSTIKLGMVRGIIILAAKKYKINVYGYSPSKAKKAVVGNGSASKHQVQSMVKHLLNLSALPTPEDAADALSLAICHAFALKSPSVHEFEI